MLKKDEGWGWVVVCACFFSGFLFDGVIYSYGLIFIEILDAFNESKALTAGISSVMFSMNMLGPLAGMLSNKYGCRVTHCAAGTIFALAYIASAFSTGVVYLYCSIGILLGLGLMGLELTRIVIIVKYFDKRRSLARGLSMSGSGFGAIVFNPLARWLIDEYGWRGALLIEGGLSLNIVACGLLMRPFSTTIPNQASRITGMQNDEDCAMPMCTDNVVITTETHSNNVHEIKIHVDGTCVSQNENEEHFKTPLNKSLSETLVQSTTNRQSNSAKLLDLKLCTQPTFLAMFIATFFLGLAHTVPFTFLPDMVVSSGWTRRQATWIMTAIGITNTASRVLLAMVMDITSFNRVLAFAILLICVGVIVVSMPLSQHYAILMAVSIVYAVFATGYCILHALVSADLFGEKLIADTSGLCSIAFGVGSLIVGPLTGAIFDASGSYIVAFIAVGASFMLSGALYIPMHKIPKKKGFLTK